MPAQIQKLAATCRALGDETRLRILGLLMGSEVCVCDIHRTLRISQPKASRHLAALRRAGLVAARRDGLWVHYSIAASCGPAAHAVLAAIGQALPRTAAAGVHGRGPVRASRCAAPSKEGP